MNICIFPGTFNPIHNAHIKVAEFALEKFDFDKIIFIPSFLPPHKDIDKGLAKHRLNMVKLATSNNPRLEVSDIEYKIGAIEEKSYSLITVKEIKKLYNIDGKLRFLIGTDAFEKIETWYKVDELKELVHFIVFPRGVKLSPKEGYDYELTDMEFIDISSTELRESQNYDTPNEVKEYIKKNDLYKS